MKGLLKSLLVQIGVFEFRSFFVQIGWPVEIGKSPSQQYSNCNITTLEDQAIVREVHIADVGKVLMATRPIQLVIRWVLRRF